MIYMESIRNNAFWLLDEIRGGKIKNHLDQIRFILQNNNSSSLKIKEDLLSQLLNHARKTTGFYNQINPAASLYEFPVINKNTIRKDPDSFTTKDPRYKMFKTVVTSGSTGTPFSINQDKRKSYRNTADTIYFGELANYTPGQRLYYFKIWNNFNKKSPLRQFYENIIPVDVSNLDEQALYQIYHRLKRDPGSKSLLSYASVYDALNSFMENNHFRPLRNNVKAVISMSESLSPVSRGKISHHLGAVAVSRYSNMENGILAQQLPDESDEFILNEASYFFEVLELDSENPAPAGNPGRIVITDLFNFCMPMIRYDTGDIGVMGVKKTGDTERPVLKKVEGRKMDMIFNTSGSLISSFIITNNMWKYKEISQYQFIQNSEKEYSFILNTERSFERENELIKEFMSYLGRDAVIRIEYVSEIPVLDSGKRKKVINKALKPIT